MQFDSTVAGIPCQCRVTRYAAEVPMRLTGSGFGDAEPPEPEEFEFELLDRQGHRAPWLEAKLTATDAARLKAEFLTHRDDEETLYE